MKLKKFVLCVCVGLLFEWANCSSNYEDYLNLETVQVLFRHGERSPEKVEAELMKDKNPLNEMYGFGQLTNTGKRQEFRLGEALRRRYGDFLGSSYKPGDVYARSSAYDRTKVSLELVLASLYPPTGELVWNEDLRWLPIPIHYLPKQLDNLFLLSNCPRYQRNLKQVMNSRDVKYGLAKHENVMKFLQKMYPDVQYNLENVFYLNNLLNMQKSFNLTLPSWYKPEIHERITAAAKFYLDTLSFTPSLIRLNGGGMTKKWVENMDPDDARMEPGPKIYLYSGHEFTVYAVAKAHNVTLKKSPAFGSALILEKLRDDEGYVYVKMYYWTGPSEELIPIKLDCGEYCTLDGYLNLVSPSLPSENEMLCLFKNLKTADLD